MHDVHYRRFVPAEAGTLAEFLSTESWPYHGGGTPAASQVREQAAAGHFDNDQTRTFWIVADASCCYQPVGDGGAGAGAGNGAGALIGLIRLMDLGDSTPLFDLRIRAACRGKGLGTAAVRWLTAYLFTEFPGLRRIEGHTRQDNEAMRRAFRACGYVKEAHHRQAWPSPGGTIYDAIGYAIVRTDWQAGTVTPPVWDDEPELSAVPKRRGSGRPGRRRAAHCSTGS
jgi:RimJ/RimL family protein N-acetyltransferase